MSTKKLVLELLEQNKGQIISGAKIGEGLHLSRSAVWKAIDDLRRENYEIQAITNRGYCLSEATDVLSPQGIASHLKHKNASSLIFTYPVLESTNQTAKKAAIDGAPHGTLIVASQQTKGRGRLGRTFFSPENCGLYLSLILRPKELGLSSSDAVLLTTAASVAVARAIAEVVQKQVEIKWVNDLYLEGRKVCGILTEGVSDFESGTIDSVIIGIGINYAEPPEGYPEELKEIAGALLSAKEAKTAHSRNRLLASIYDHLMEVTDQTRLQTRDFIKEYKQRSFLLGKDINVISYQGTYPAKALDITTDGGLVVQSDDGRIHTLTTGEISIRILNRN